MDKEPGLGWILSAPIWKKEFIKTIKGQDFGKIIVGIGIIVCVILSTIASASGTESAIGIFCHTAVDYLKNVILG